MSAHVESPILSRLAEFISPNTGDILIFANTPQGYTFWFDDGGQVFHGWHASATDEDAFVPMGFSYPGRFAVPGTAAQLPDMLSPVREELQRMAQDYQPLTNANYRELIHALYQLEVDD